MLGWLTSRLRRRPKADDAGGSPAQRLAASAPSDLGGQAAAGASGKAPGRASLWQRARALLPSRSKAQVPELQTLKAQQIEGKTYLFGLEWRLIPPTRALVRTLSLARKEGKSVYVISEMEDIIGVGNVQSGFLAQKYSAALHLASKFSQGGLELYVFELSNGQVAVIALNESRPIPGFDYLGDMPTARSLIDEFLAIQAGQPIRQVGNAGLLEAEEPVAPEDLFAVPAKAARVKGLPGARSTRLILGIGLVLSLVIGGGMYWMDQERQRVIEQNRMAMETPDVIYRRSLTQALRSLPSAGPERMQAWLSTVRQLPLSHQGWRLIRVECSGTECKAQWDRVYGNFSDFIRSLPAGAYKADEVQVNNSPLTASILSWHTAKPASEVQARIVTEDLPQMQDGLRKVSDHFQDLSLLGRGSAEMEKPVLFGGDGDPSVIDEPVFHGRWTVSQELWLLPFVEIAPHSVIDTLELIFFDSKGQPLQVFKLKGTYYVRSAKKS